MILNAKDEDLELMRSRVETRQAEMKKNKEKKTKVKQETAKVTAVPTTSTAPVKRPGAIVSVPANKKVKADYSVAKDPQVSDVYKSIFTSHKSEKEQNRAHWITYNPFYN